MGRIVSSRAFSAARKASKAKKRGGISVVVVVKAKPKPKRRTSRTVIREVIREVPVFIAQPGQIISPAKELAKRFRRGSARSISIQKEVRTIGERRSERAGRRVTASGRFRGRAK